MTLRALVGVVGLAALAAAVALPAAAQAPGPPERRVVVRHVRPRIEVVPAPLIYRHCSSWYVLQARPSGTVLFPQQHCWWARR